MHCAVHSGERAFTCKQCNKPLCGGTKSIILEEFSCQHCCKTFLEAGHLKYHMGVHTNQESICCSTCGKCFRNAQVLKIHLVVIQVKNVSNAKYVKNHLIKEGFFQGLRQGTWNFNVVSVESPLPLKSNYINIYNGMPRWFVNHVKNISKQNNT